MLDPPDHLGSVPVAGDGHSICLLERRNLERDVDTKEAALGPAICSEADGRGRRFPESGATPWDHFDRNDE